MSLGAILLGIINIAITVAVLLLVGAIVLWFCQWMGFAVPDLVQKLYIGVVALVALYMLVALILGLPHWRVIGGGKYPEPFRPGGAAAAISAGAASHL